VVEKNEGLRILIITGLSGAGKTQTVNCLEDIGYYCVDNLPPALLTKFVELGRQSEGKIDKVALVMDARGGDFFLDLSRALEELQQDHLQYEILFLEASDEVLVRRFKESRRKHPLSGRWRLLEAIQIEKTMLEELRGQANVVIDTSNTSSRELREKLISLYGEQSISGFSINVVSFGYKMGIPLDSDIVIDVRFLPNLFNVLDKVLIKAVNSVKAFIISWSGLILPSLKVKVSSPKSNVSPGHRSAPKFSKVTLKSSKVLIFSLLRSSAKLSSIKGTSVLKACIIRFCLL
jgi:RNase adaptor protein for sRNA GlmZ degradation